MLRWRHPRRAMVSLWTLLMIPALLVLFAVVVEGVHLWLARVELENALESAALAAVKEWAESGSGPAPGWTEGARIVGQTYAAANSINQTPVSIDTNLGTYSDTNPNENLSCEGNLVFGAIIEDDPVFVVATDQAPSCMGGAGRVLVEVTSQNLTSEDNAWGVSFPTNPDEDFQDMLIERIVLEIDPNNTGRLRFDFSGSGLAPILSASSPQPLVQGPAPNSDGVVVQSEQPDNFGFVGWFFQTSPFQPTVPPGTVQEWPGPGQTSPQIQFSSNADANGIATVLTIDFFPYVDQDDNVLDTGFGAGDRFRFGAGVVRVTGGGNFATADGDDIGREGVRITVYFKDIPDPVTSIFTDTGFSSNQCASNRNPGEWEQDDLGNWHLLVHPLRSVTPGTSPLIARDLPCPLTSAANNDKQSIVLALGRGVGVGNYVVRAQASHQVPSLICSFLGIDFGGPFTVSACTTAMYDCELQRPRLIRVEPENFYCPTGPVLP
jgi:Flp pilus assembly protein TadG